MSALREATELQLGVERPAAVLVPPEDCERFADDLPQELDARLRAELERRTDELQPWLQGPFWIGGDLVIGGAWRNDCRWRDLRPQVGDLGGARVLDVGSNAGYDAFMFSRLGARAVVGVEPAEFVYQARFLESVYRRGVEFLALGWQDLDPEVHGTFDLVHCHGVLYHEREPLRLLERLRDLTAEDGTLLVGTMMLGDPDLADYVRFVPGTYLADATWWWVPGRIAAQRMLGSCGLEVHEAFGVHDGPAGEFDVVNGYFRTTRRRA
jgi:SAM-dependent methyltransferase